MTTDHSGGGRGGSAAAKGPVSMASAGEIRTPLEVIFPLPRLTEPPPLRRNAGRGVQQRVGRHRKLVDDYNGVVDALNWCAGGALRPPVSCSFSAEVQTRTWDRVVTLQPEDALPSPQAVFDALLRGRSPYDGCSAGANLVTFPGNTRVSLPEDLDGAPFVDEMVPTHASQYLRGEGKRMMYDIDELSAEEDSPHAYWDPRLARSRLKYLLFMKKLVRLGLVVAVPAGSAREQCGLFFVAKTGKKKCRLVIDARRANRYFRPPPGVKLCTGEGLAKIEVQLPDDFDFSDPRHLAYLNELEATLGLADVKDAFHRFRIRQFLAVYSGVGRAVANDVGARYYMDGHPIDPRDEVDLCWGSLPMGFSWSLYFCQESNGSRLDDTHGLEQSQRLADRSPAAALAAHWHDAGLRGRGRAHYLYVDNIGVLGFGNTMIGDVMDQATKSFEKDRLMMHEIQVLPTQAKALGTDIDLVRMRSTIHRARPWKLRQALVWALRCRRLPGRVWEVIVGHLTFAFMIERAGLSIFLAIYAFMRVDYYEAAPLWETARQEMTHALACLLMMVSEWTIPWSSWVLATDASEYGGAGVCCRWPQWAVAAAGRIPERSRFKLAPGRSARSDCFATVERGLEVLPVADEPADIDDDIDVNTALADFPEIDHRLIDHGQWQTLFQVRWRYFDQDIFELESRALVTGFKALVSSKKLSNCRILCLIDNMSVCLSYERRRTKKFAVLRAIREISAWATVLGIRVSFRWVPSEINPSDDGSRVFQPDGPLSKAELASPHDHQKSAHRVSVQCHHPSTSASIATSSSVISPNDRPHEILSTFIQSSTPYPSSSTDSHVAPPSASSISRTNVAREPPAHVRDAAAEALADPGAPTCGAHSLSGVTSTEKSWARPFPMAREEARRDHDRAPQPGGLGRLVPRGRQRRDHRGLGPTEPTGTKSSGSDEAVQRHSHAYGSPTDAGDDRARGRDGGSGSSRAVHRGSDGVAPTRSKRARPARRRYRGGRLRGQVLEHAVQQGSPGQSRGTARGGSGVLGPGVRPTWQSEAPAHPQMPQRLETQDTAAQPATVGVADLVRDHLGVDPGPPLVDGGVRVDDGSDLYASQRAVGPSKGGSLAPATRVISLMDCLGLSSGTTRTQQSICRRRERRHVERDSPVVRHHCRGLAQRQPEGAGLPLHVSPVPDEVESGHRQVRDFGGAVSGPAFGSLDRHGVALPYPGGRQGPRPLEERRQRQPLPEQSASRRRLRQDGTSLPGVLPAHRAPLRGPLCGDGARRRLAFTGLPASHHLSEKGRHAVLLYADSAAAANPLSEYGFAVRRGDARSASSIRSDAKRGLITAILAWPLSAAELRQTLFVLADPNLYRRPWMLCLSPPLQTFYDELRDIFSDDAAVFSVTWMTRILP